MSDTIALYIRLSAEDDNVGESDSIKNQRDLLYDYLSLHEEFSGHKVLEFNDDGWSGTNFERPGVKKLLELAKKKEIGCIIVKDFSRFGRNFIDVCDYIDQIFPFLGIRFIAVNENYDSSKSKGSTAPIDVAFKTLIHEMYSRDTSDKLTAIYRAKMAKGEHTCGIAFYGYLKSKTEKNKLVVDEPAAMVIRRIFQMACDGMNLNEIAITMNRENIPTPIKQQYINGSAKMRGWKIAGDGEDSVIWTRYAVKRILRDERYTGKMVFKKRTKVGFGSKKTVAVPQKDWIIVPDTHDAIITEEVYAKAQSVFAPSKACNIHGKKPHLFVGKLKCAYCNHSLSRQPGKEPVFVCATSRAMSEADCKNLHLSEENLKRDLFSLIYHHAELALNASDEDVKSKAAGQLCHLQRLITDVGERIDKIKLCKILDFEELSDGKLSKGEYMSRKANYDEQITVLKGQIELWSNEIEKEQQKNSFGSRIKQAQSCVLGTELTRDILEQFVGQIRVYNDNTFEVVWNFRDNLQNTKENEQNG